MAKAYYTDLFSPETYQAFSQSDRSVSGFRLSQQGMADRVKPGDRLICYMTKLSRWVGVLEVVSTCFHDASPLFLSNDDPFVLRFKVKCHAWLDLDQTLPIHDPAVWGKLSFTRTLRPGDLSWTGIVRRSLNRLKDEDGKLLDGLILKQAKRRASFPVDPENFQKLLTKHVRRGDKSVPVIVPDSESEIDEDGSSDASNTRESASIQALLAEIGETMGFRVWVPRSDRGPVLKIWKPKDGTLIETLPLNYDEATLKTIENIDVLWLQKRFIVRAFEVEHTTAVYSGLLRMADLLALQPNMEIKLHIVAPELRKQKVFTEILRPVFSLLEKAPLAECCTFISYDSLKELHKLKHLSRMSDEVLEDYAERAEA